MSIDIVQVIERYGRRNIARDARPQRSRDKVRSRKNEEGRACARPSLRERLMMQLRA
jgi:hypothetical protein